MTRITLADIAQRAGVHTTTVSRAMRNHPALPVATRTRLQNLARDMGYVPDPALAALMAYRRQAAVKPRGYSLAYVTNWFSAKGWMEMPAHQQFHEGAAAKSAALGYQLEHFWLGERDMTPGRLSAILFHRGVSGIILASHRFRPEEELNFDWQRFAAVKIDYHPVHPAIDSVSNDQRAIVQLAVHKTLAAGYRRIGFVLADKFDCGASYAWSAGFLAEQIRMREKDRVPLLRFDTSDTIPGPLTSVQPIHPDVFLRWFRRHQPEVIIGYGPHLRPTLAELDLESPRDVGFVELFLEADDGSTAGVRENCRRVGEVAVDVLVSQIHQNRTGIPPVPTSTLVEGTWVDGASLPPRRP